MECGIVDGWMEGGRGWMCARKVRREDGRKSEGRGKRISQSIIYMRTNMKGIMYGITVWLIELDGWVCIFIMICSVIMFNCNEELSA